MKLSNNEYGGYLDTHMRAHNIIFADDWTLTHVQIGMIIIKFKRFDRENCNR
jgi:hypothetical protein